MGLGVRVRNSEGVAARIEIKSLADTRQALKCGVELGSEKKREKRHTW